MEILIEKDRIYPYAIRISTQIAKMTGTAGSNLILTRDQYPLLDSYMEMAVSDGESALHKLLGNSNNFSLEASSQNILFCIRNSKRINNNLAGLIKTQIMMYCCNAIIAMWIAPVNAELSTQYKQSAAGNLKSVSDAVLFRANYMVEDYDYDEKSNDNVQSKSELSDGKENPIKDIIYKQAETQETKEKRMNDYENRSSVDESESFMRNVDRVSDKENNLSESELRKEDKYSSYNSGGVRTEEKKEDIPVDYEESQLDFQKKMDDETIIDRKLKREIITCCPFKP